MKLGRREDRILSARRAQARGLPGSLPATDVESLPMFGTSWYTRGARYYLCRALAVVLLLIGLAVAVTLDVSFVLGLAGSSSGARIAWGLIVGALCLVSFVRPLRTLRDQRERRRAGEIVYPIYVPGAKRASVGGAGIGALARVGSGLAGAFLVVASVVFLGWYVVAFLETFRGEYGVEHDARLRMQQQAKWGGPGRTQPRPGRKR